MKQLEEGIWNVIRRYSDESDVTVGETVQVLEMIKAALLHMHFTKTKEEKE